MCAARRNRNHIGRTGKSIRCWERGLGLEWWRRRSLCPVLRARVHRQRCCCERFFIAVGGRVKHCPVVGTSPGARRNTCLLAGVQVGQTREVQRVGRLAAASARTHREVGLLLVCVVFRCPSYLQRRHSPATPGAKHTVMAQSQGGCTAEHEPGVALGGCLRHILHIKRNRQQRKSRCVSL